MKTALAFSDDNDDLDRAFQAHQVQRDSVFTNAVRVMNNVVTAPAKLVRSGLSLRK